MIGKNMVEKTTENHDNLLLPSEYVVVIIYLELQTTRSEAIEVPNVKLR